MKSIPRILFVLCFIGIASCSDNNDTTSKSGIDIQVKVKIIDEGVCVGEDINVTSDIPPDRFLPQIMGKLILACSNLLSTPKT